MNRYGLANTGQKNLPWICQMRQKTGITPEEAAKVVVAEKQLLSDYLAASVALTKSYLDQIKEEQLSDVIDKIGPRR